MQEPAELLIIFLGAVYQGALLVMLDDQPRSGFACRIAVGGLASVSRVPGIVRWWCGRSLRHHGMVFAAAGAGRSGCRRVRAGCGGLADWRRRLGGAGKGGRRGTWCRGSLGRVCLRRRGLRD